MLKWIKKWLLDRDFVFKYVQAQINGAEKSFKIATFRDAQKDILETMRDDLDKKAEELAAKRLSELLVGTDLNHIVRLDKLKGILSIGGERATEAQLGNLKAEAEYFTQSSLWKLIYETPKELAQKSMFSDDGTLENLLIKGRAMLFTLATQKNIIDIFSSYEPKK